ncbi:SUN domain-containing protein 5-like [Athene noctua]|uniref:SUN domain-containing protein 5-like n=1 Tax=Athene noctua TaxID=126797 RepID=UPI003EB923F7
MPRRAPLRRCRGAPRGSLGSEGSAAEPQPVESSGSLCVEMEVAVRFLPAASGSNSCGKAAAETAGTVSSLPCHPRLASLGRILLGMCIFAMQRVASHKKRFLQVIVLLAVALAGGYCWTSLPAWSTCTEGLVEELRRVCAAPLETLRNWQTLLAEETQNKERLREQVAQLKAKFSSAEEVQDSSQAAPAKVSAATYDWALKSSGASIDMRRTSEAFSCTHWRCSVVEWFSQSTPDAVLEPDMSPGNCWPLPRHQGQVVIRLPARVHLTAVSVQHIYKDVSPSGTVVSAPRDVAVFGLDADGEEEALLLTFTYDVTKEAIQTFPLKTAPFPRAFSYVKFLVKSNWGNPEYTCVYRVQVHGLRAGAGTS